MWTLVNIWFMDLLAEAATAYFLVYATRALDRARSLLFQGRWLVLLGGFFYSCLRMYDPMLSVLHFTLMPYEFGAATFLTVLLVACVPICASVAYVLHLVFERPFMPGHPHTPDRAAHAAVFSPAL